MNSLLDVQGRERALVGGGGTVAIGGWFSSSVRGGGRLSDLQSEIGVFQDLSHDPRHTLLLDLVSPSRKGVGRPYQSKYFVRIFGKFAILGCRLD